MPLDQTDQETISAWHFADDRLRDGAPLPSDSEALNFSGNVAICRSGLHASRRLVDALKYAPGNTLCRVECDGVSAELDDKLVCSSRTIVWRLDAEEVFRESTSRSVRGSSSLRALRSSRSRSRSARRSRRSRARSSARFSRRAALSRSSSLRLLRRSARERSNSSRRLSRASLIWRRRLILVSSASIRRIRSSSFMVGSKDQGRSIG